MRHFGNYYYYKTNNPECKELVDKIINCYGLNIGLDMFRLYNRKKSSDIALPDTEELGYDDVLVRILNIQSIFEKAIGKEICEWYFPESITTLSQFSI